MLYLIDSDTYKRLVNQVKSKRNEYITRDEALNILDRSSLFRIETKRLFRLWEIMLKTGGRDED